MIEKECSCCFFELKFPNEIKEVKRDNMGWHLEIVGSRIAENDDFEVIADSKSVILKSSKKFKLEMSLLLV